MNVSEFTQRIAEIEGKKHELSIAQIKEVIRCAQDVLFNLSDSDQKKLYKASIQAAEKRAAKRK